MKKIYTLLFLVSFYHFTFAQLTGMNPNQGQAGQTLTTTITSNSLFYQTGSPSGNIIDLHLQGSSYINLLDYLNTLVIDPNTATTTFTIPITAVAGSYTLSMQDLSFNTYTLPNAFTVVPPDGYAQGKVFYDTNGNGVFDTGEPGLSSQLITINPGNMTTYTDGSGNYSFPLSNGNYSLSYSGGNSHSYVLTAGTIANNITINSANAVQDYAVTDGLYGLSPNTVYPGEQLTLLIYSYNLFSGTGSGNINFAYFIGGQYFYVVSKTVLSPSMASLHVSIPANQTLGNYNLVMQIGNANYYQTVALHIIQAPSQVSGHIFYDSNNNGVYDSGEPPMFGQEVMLVPDSIRSFTDTLGNYSIGASLGTHTLSFYSPNGSYVLSSGTPPSYTFTNSGNVSGFDFGLLSNLPDYSSSISMTTGIPRCSTEVHTYIHVTNTSNVTESGYVYAIISSNVTYANSIPALSYQNGDTLFWNFNNLSPAAIFTVDLSYMACICPHANLIVHAVSVVLDGSGNPVYPAPTTCSYMILCSWDPNDKSVQPEGQNEIMHYTNITDTLVYLVRFQNTGNDTAFNVLIRDTLDASLNIQSLQIVSSSHDVEARIDSERAITFRFANILLPDSNIDEQGSHGYVQYRVAPNTGIPDPTVIRNKAYIYFDFNPPVITNETWNTMVTNIPLSVNEMKLGDGLTFYPNPFSDYSTVTFKNNAKDKMLLQMIDFQGKIIFDKTITTDHLQIARSGLAAGLYVIRVINVANGRIMSGKIVIR